MAALARWTTRPCNRDPSSRVAFALVAAFPKNARLKDDTGAPPEASRMTVNLAEDHEALIRGVRDDAADVADLRAGVLEEHDKMAWMLRSMLE